MASPKLKKAIRDLGESIQGEMHEAFAAGWNAFLATHSGLLIAHGMAYCELGSGFVRNRAFVKEFNSKNAPCQCVIVRID